jgi:ABC-type uncharacterized transport system permease subunit
VKWNEEGVLLSLNFFAAMDRLTPESIIFAFESTHPPPQLRMPVVQSTANTFRMTGGNARAAQAQGLPVGSLIVACCVIAGACVGLAGFFEVAAIHGQANASLVAGYGFTGILVSFLARHNPLAVVPVAILFGALAAAGGVVQRRMGMPDATVLVLQGIMFVVLLALEITGR